MRTATKEGGQFEVKTLAICIIRYAAHERYVIRDGASFSLQEISKLFSTSDCRQNLHL